MSTIKSSAEHLTLNADGASKDIKFQANGVEKASISSRGAFTSTTIDATKLTGNLPAISGANLTGITTGKVLQVAQGSPKTTVSTTTSSSASATGLTASITTTETNSKILVFCSVNGLEKNNLNNYGKLYLYKGTTLVLRWEAWIGYGIAMAYYPGSGALGSSSLTYLDSPTHTSGDTLTYNVYFSAHSGNFSVNVVPSQSIITLMEIGA